MHGMAIDGVGTVNEHVSLHPATLIDRVGADRLERLLKAEAAARGVVQVWQVEPRARMGDFVEVRVTYGTTRSAETHCAECDRLVQAAMLFVALVHALDRCLEATLVAHAQSVLRTAEVPKAALAELEGWRRALTRDLQRSDGPLRHHERHAEVAELRLISSRIDAIESYINFTAQEGAPTQ